MRLARCDRSELGGQNRIGPVNQENFPDCKTKEAQALPRFVCNSTDGGDLVWLLCFNHLLKRPERLSMLLSGHPGEIVMSGGGDPERQFRL